MTSSVDAPAMTVDVGEVIDSADVAPLHYGIFALCALCMIMDGFDVQALGYVAPAIIADWKIAPSLLGPVFGASNFGVLVGQLTFTMLADKVGRRPVLIFGTVSFSLLTVMTAFVHSVPELLVMRFVAGTALGSIIPNATALIGEFTPRSVRIQLVTYIGIGFTAGAVLGGFVAASLIPAYGWRSVFVAGGLAPLAIAFAMLVWLPESVRLLVLQRKRPAYVATWLKKLNRKVDIAPGAQFVAREEQKSGVPLLHLLGAERGMVTILLWIVFFMNLFNLYSLANWLPTVVRAAGYSTRTAVLVGTTLQVGGTVSPFLMAWLVMKNGFLPVLASVFLLGAVTIALIGQPMPLLALVAIVFVAGACIVGSQPTLNALGASYYPTYLRSTGLGWALGIGRAGSIVGPVVAGQFLAWKWSNQSIFLALTVPAIVSAVAVFALQWAMQKDGPTKVPVADVPLAAH